MQIKTRTQRRAEQDAVTKLVESETIVDSTAEGRRARLLTRLESSESLEFVAEISKDRKPDETTALLGETSNLVAAAAALAALWRTNDIRAAEVLMRLSTPRGAELLRIMIVSLNDTEAATALVALEEPGRVVDVSQFLMPYSSRSVLYKAGGVFR